MRVGAIPEGLIERIVMRLGVAPRPLIDTQMAFTLGRVIMAGADLGVFETLADGPATAAEVAERLGTDPHATEKLLFALATSDYLRVRNERYELTKAARKWLLSSSPTDLTDKLRFQLKEWGWMAQTEEYVRTGRPLDIHHVADSEVWDSYQRGMRAMAASFSAEAVRRLPVPKGARDLLDIGGSHGYYSVALCRRYEGLRAVVLDLPEAVEKAAPLLAAEGMGDRVVHRARGRPERRPGGGGLGRRDDRPGRSPLQRGAEPRARRPRGARLRPGGVYAILDAFRPRHPGDAGQLPSLLEFYFALTSQSGTWTPEEMAAWQRGAGLAPKRAIRLRTVPGGGIQAAVKPGGSDAS